MATPELSLRTNAVSTYRDHEAGYIAQLVAPMDDMWAAFADMAAPHALRIGDEVVGSCCADDDRQLLRFYVEAPFLDRAEALLRLALRELGVRRMMVPTSDPGFLSAALDVGTGVECHTLLFEHVVAPARPGLDGLVVAEPGDHARLVAFEADATGAPLGFLESYIAARLDRRELLVLEAEGEILSIGELRRDTRQDRVAQLGVVVGKQHRGKGIASAMMASLVRRSRDEGLRPCCSTEVGNMGARRAIERAGFQARHRLLAIGAGS
ncbi:MAG: GNAT family N-acetyltransferase [Myxococcota bacterium]